MKNSLISLQNEKECDIKKKRTSLYLYIHYIDDNCFIGTTPKIARVPYKGLFAPKWVKTIFPKGVKIEKLKYSENKNSRMDKLVDSILNR